MGLSSTVVVVRSFDAASQPFTRTDCICFTGNQVTVVRDATLLRYERGAWGLRAEECGTLSVGGGVTLGRLIIRGHDA